MVNPITIGRNVEIIVHNTLCFFVDCIDSYLNMVRNKLNNIKLIPVKAVKPPCIDIAVSFTDSSSRHHSCTLPTAIFVVNTVSIKTVGTTISFAGIAITYARIITPFNPIKNANGSTP